MRSTKSKMSSNGPFSWRSATMKSLTPSPTPRMPARPNLHALGHGRELVARLVDVGGQHVDAVVAAGRDVVDDLFRLARVGGEHGCHVLARVVGLEPGGLHDEDGVAGRVRLVEGVGGKLEDVVPNFLGDLARVAVRHGAVHPVVVGGLLLAVLPLEDGAREQLDLFLGHRLADARVALAGREAAHLHRDLHDLFLVDHRAVGLAQDVVEARVVGDGLLLAVHAVDVAVDHACAQRSGAVEGDECHDVLVLARPHVLDGRRHAAGLDLEHAGGVARAHELEDLGVVEGDRVDVDVDAGRHLDVRLGARDDREGAQAQEVHLEQAHVGHHVAFVLGDLDAALGVELGGHVLVDRVAADEDGAGVHALAAGEALEGARHVDDALRVGVLLVGLDEVGREVLLLLLVLAHRGCERGVGCGRDHLGELLAERDRADRARAFASLMACFALSTE